jgi:hypothetical protein
MARHAALAVPSGMGIDAREDVLHVRLVIVPEVLMAKSFPVAAHD